MEDFPEEGFESQASIVRFGFVSVVVVLALLALFIWQPWNMMSPSLRGEKTIVTQPG